jgi:hypothetical protein
MSNSPYINHFLSPDTIIPDQTTPQNLNRYSYVLNNPLHYTDPTGHRACGDGDDVDCSGNKQDPLKNPHPAKQPKTHKTDKTTTGPDIGKYIAGGVTLVAGVITMAIGGVVMASAYGEIVGGAAAAPETFGLSAVVALIHAPAELALGGIIFGVGVGLAYLGGKTMIESEVPTAIYDKVTQAIRQ